ncbi:MAG TPA: hypothetical protein VFZ66_09355 [Herpetosiphonaceae bacterium]
MDTSTIAQRLRSFLLVLSGCLCIFTAVELLLSEHMESAIQLIPLALCGLGLVAVLAALIRPQRAILWALRLIMALLIAGSLFGIVEHWEANIAFERDIRPNAATGVVVLAALRGASPLLAPGMLALAGTLGLGATYYHPALGQPTTASERRFMGLFRDCR